MSNGIMLPGPRPAQALQVATPLNDVQLLALVAATLPDGAGLSNEAKAADRVGLALEIVAEAFVQFNSGSLEEAVERRQSRATG